MTRVTTILIALLTSVAVADDVRFNRDVLPILSNHCFACHGPDASKREAGLRLDQSEAATGATESGAHAILPGDPGGSELIRRITSSDPDERMPPADGPNPLDDEQVAVLKAWIEQGARYEAHWAFTPIAPPVLPDVDHPAWPKNDIDRFVLAKLDERRLAPTNEATRETLIRRAAFDLTGLPPTIDEIDTYLTDQSDEAYEHMVDRYLNSPAYGEHMARHWLDLARYADTNGYQYDTEREQWVWRDWVIDAYNRNKPFDEFTIEQLAGDLLPNATPQQRLATGFNRNHGVTIEGGIIDEEYRTEYVMDRLVTSGEVWLGLTVGCARCHDHKFDPLSQQEFYQLYAYFNQVPEKGMQGFAPQEKIPSPLAGAQQKEFDTELDQLRARLDEGFDEEEELKRWAAGIANEKGSGWQVLVPESMTSSGGSTLTKQDDNSIVVGGANPQQDIYEITSRTEATNLTAVRLEALTDPSLPGGGPGRHSNSNFVLSEFELTVVSLTDSATKRPVKFVRAMADYEQSNYEVAKAIDGTVANSNGWAVDGPTRKENATAIFIAEEPFGFDGGTELRFRLRHEAGFATHGVGRPRFSATTDDPDNVSLTGVPADIRTVAAIAAARRSTEQSGQLRDYFLKYHDPRMALQKRIAEIEQRRAAAFPATMVMRELPQPRLTRMLNRGQYNEPTDEVSPGVPGVFPPLPSDAPANRLGLARWLVAPNHPLTARVAVNRYWQRLFGIGLVKTSEDFGVQGELPTNPELLDWLALEFMHSGWNVKHIQRLIMTSATYRQSSHAGAEAYRRDPENRWLARGPRMRLDGEEIRDAALAASRLLKRRVGGKSVYPYQPAGLWMELNNRPGYSKEYPQGSGDDLYRRSMYTFWKRTVPSPMLKTFDAPEREFCTIRRSRTNTPSQALVLLNSPQFVEAARNLGQRMMQYDANSVSEKLGYGFRLVTARTPTDRELTILVETLRSEREKYSNDPELAMRLLQVGESSFDRELETGELAAFASVASLLLNLNEAITKG